MVDETTLRDRVASRINLGYRVALRASLMEEAVFPT